jgi:SWIM zinc finger
MQSYDEGRRFYHMTTNLVECINGVFKGFRKLPLMGVVQGSYYRLNRFFQERRETYVAQLQTGKVHSETVRVAMDKNIARSSSLRVTQFDAESLLFEVLDPYDESTSQVGRTYKLELRARRCDCGAFQAKHYPCVHAVAACVRMGWDSLAYVHPCFRLDTMIQAYNTHFQPLGDVSSWPPYMGPTVWPDPEKRRSKYGRPKEARIHNEMDAREPVGTIRCSRCKGVGHNKKRCPQRNRNL